MRLTPAALYCLLRRLEWVEGGHCPECRGNRSHRPGCELGAALDALLAKVSPAVRYADPWAMPTAIPVAIPVGRPCNRPKAC